MSYIEDARFLKVKWAPEPVWTFLENESSLVPAGIRKMDRPALSLVAKRTELCSCGVSES